MPVPKSPALQKAPTRLVLLYDTSTFEYTFATGYSGDGHLIVIRTYVAYYIDDFPALVRKKLQILALAAEGVTLPDVGFRRQSGVFPKMTQYTVFLDKDEYALLADWEILRG